MSNIIIKVQNLSKRYCIGSREPYEALRDKVVDAMCTPFRAMVSALNGRRSAIVNQSPNNYIWALKDVSFEVKCGEVLGIIGRNGAGKSTLLKILSRITEPTGGYAEIHGRVGSLLEVGTGFHPELTGRENIYLNGAILGMKKKEIERKFDEIVAFAEVEKFIDTPVKRYSSGMYLRLAFSVAAHLEPEILLVDEVLAVGDAVFQKKCLGKMGEVANAGRTVLFVSHNVTSIVQLCTHAIRMHSGKIVEQGDPRKVSFHYWRDYSVPLEEATFDPSDVSQGAALLRAYVMDEALSIRPEIPYARPFYIVLEYHIGFPIGGLRVGIRLHNEHNLAVLHTATSDCPSLDGIAGKPGQHRARVQIPGAWLAPGRYYAEIGIWSPKVGHHHHLANALAFDIIDTALGGVGEEALRPEVSWVVE